VIRILLEHSGYALNFPGSAYCAAVRGVLNDSQDGPLHPPGVRMSEALQDVRDSLERNLQAKKGGVPSRC